MRKRCGIIYAKAGNDSSRARCTRMSPIRFIALAGTALLLITSAGAIASDLPAAHDLAADAAEARAARLPIVVFFYSTTCPFCRQVEDTYLPLALRDNVPTPHFILRTVDIQSAEALVGFDGHETDMRRFAAAQGVRLVPHLRFLDADGQPLAPDLIGLNPPDFYSGYLDDAIRQAWEKLNRRIGVGGQPPATTLRRNVHDDLSAAPSAAPPPRGGG